ncbi:MAG TPA: UDP-N-acetylmuramoyl-L-alanine--D-glutamate ligase [Polyangiales bacterium]|nr:UDP-N-acetylmuramoyl-L-alanine--D-glutamate ligase [Polyangiales bacterium]
MDIAGKLVVIVGLGKSGMAAARVCSRLGARVLGTDSRPRAELSEALALGIEVVAGGHQDVPFASAAYVVVSPGVPAFPELDAAAGAGAEVIGELELACRLLSERRPRIVAVGGTNGKSTTTLLVYELLGGAAAGVFVGGNFGTPACEAVFGDATTLVLEVSSFQLERAPRFRPNVSVLLNVTDDHLDRYASFEEYARAKGNAFANQEPGDVAVIPASDPGCRAQAQRGRGRQVTFGEASDYFAAGDELVEAASGARVALHGAKLHGAHNLNNAAAAFAAARALGASLEGISAGLARFEPLGHRMALAGELSGVRFYDDSKATNVGAAVTALLGLRESRAVLIAGGRDKLGSYEPLVSALRQKGRAVVLIGEASDRIAGAIGDALPLVRARSMDEAVARARELAQPGDAVLLSPACSSFDMFRSYADRGDHFVRAVEALSGVPSTGRSA